MKILEALRNLKNIKVDYLLYLTIFLLPLQTRWIIWPAFLNGAYFEYGTISLYAIDILIIALFFYDSGKFFKDRFKEKKFNDYWWILSVLEFSIFISVVFSLNKHIALYGYFKFLLGLGLFYLLLNLKYDRLKLIYSFLAGIFIESILAVWQFLSQSSFSSKWLGMAGHDPLVPGTSVVETLDGVRFLRAYGSLDHPNVLGGALAVGMFFLIFLIIQNKKFKTVNFKIFENKKIINFQILILYFLFLFFLLALFFTFSRGAWAAFLIGMILMFLYSVARKDLSVQKSLLSTALFGGILIFALFNIYGNLVQTRLSNNARLEIKSNEERISSYRTSKELIRENWFFGVGIGNYPLALKEKIIPNQPAYFYQPVHNVFLLVWAEIGIVGLLFFLIFLSFIFFFLLKSFRDKVSKNVYLIFLIIIIFFTFLVDHWWWSLHFGVLLFWFVAGFILSLSQNKKPNI